MNNKVCSVIVTYNRSEYLLELLDDLSKQSVKIDTILVVDNNSSDNTRERLMDINFTNSIDEKKLHKNVWKDITCYYYRNDKNTGGAGGFSLGIDIAKEFDVGYLWIMDDDVSPEKHCLEYLLRNMSESTQICIPNRSTGEFIDKAVVKLNMTNVFKYRYGKKTYDSNYENKEFVKVVDMPFEGPLISKDIIKQIGLPDKEYFIQYDDTDYAQRALKYTNIYFVPNAKLKKKIIPKIQDDKLMNWKNYYSYRNSIIFDKRYGENLWVKNIRPLLLCLDLSFRAIVKRKFYNLKIIKRAFIDGKLEIMGKTIEPGSM